MEDAHTTELSIVDGKKISFFAVYDGHGGSTVAQYAGKHLHGRIAKEISFQQGEYRTALKNGFLNTDIDIKEDLPSDPSGCTAVASIITEDRRIFVANAGDSRAVLSGNGTAVPLSDDHKPMNPLESQRIVAAGGFVEFGRVNGNLALSRALGDFDFKQNQSMSAENQIVTADPDISERKLEKTDEFLIIACDGIWDCMTSQQVIDYVRERIVLENGNLGLICEQIMDKCLSTDSEFGGIGCDNMTVIIVGFLWGKSKEEWVADISSRTPEFKTLEEAQKKNTSGEEITETKAST
ncbi:Protein phosphatase 2C 2 [Nowakowskiella sp. JEL0078]|nr:Protein phosphatase 2C 2 [Nowakowskiella sp. JEL0078]